MLGLVVVLCGIAGASAVHQMQTSTGLTTNSATDLVTRPGPTHVHALGRLEPAGTVRRISPRSGNEGTRVERLLIREGDDIAAGAVLAVLDNESSRQAAVVEAEARLSLARTRLEQVQAGAKPGDIAAQQFAVDILTEQMKVAEREWKRARELNEKNVLTKEDLDNKQWLRDRAALEHLRAQELLKSIREVREIDVRVAERDVVAAEAADRKSVV